MMTGLAIIVSSALVLMAAYQVGLVLIFVRLFWRHPSSQVAERLPQVSVVVPLRGVDPGLLGNLERLMRQDYPRYDLRIVVDAKEDPAWTIVEQAVRSTAASHVHQSPLDARRRTCSLKCSALVQAAGALDPSCEVMALADGDTSAHPSWLRELVGPLEDQRVGATFGNRWYVPSGRECGSLVRYLWNAAAVVPMHFLSIPWAGTMAIRVSAMARSGLVERWSRAMVDDAPVRDALRPVGLRLRFVPSLMMVNREECTCSAALEFITRQLLWTRLYHGHWPAVLLHALLSSGLVLLAAVLLVAGLAGGQWRVAAWAGAGFLAYHLAMPAMLGILERGIGRVLEARGEEKSSWPPGAHARLLLAVLLTPWFHLVAAVAAQFKRRVVWRGVVYQMRGPWDVEMLEAPRDRR